MSGHLFLGRGATSINGPVIQPAGWLCVRLNSMKSDCDEDASFWQWFWPPNQRLRVFVLFQLSTVGSV